MIYRNKTFRALTIGLVISLFAVILPTTVSAQDAKVDKAATKVCTSIDKLVNAYVALNQASETGDYKELKKEYNKTVKAWNKFVKSVDKLETVEYKESVSAYNDLSAALDLAEEGSYDKQTANKIGKHVDNAADAISSLQNMQCK